MIYSQLTIALGVIAATVGLVQAATAAGLDDLIAAAKQEGELTLIALPHSWCGNSDMLAGFKAKYGLKVNEFLPDGASVDEIAAIKASKNNKGPQAPDVIDVGLSFGPSAKNDGLIQAYKVSTWEDVPATMKDSDGFWTGGYYGVMTFMVNRDLVKKLPSDWSDLIADDYKGMVALPGDPHTSNQAAMGIYAAGLATGKGDAKDAATAGLEFFDSLNKKGNFVPAVGKAATLGKGTTPIVVLWDYNSLTGREMLKGNPQVDVVFPKSGSIAGVYVQAISAYAPHVNAAKLWLEYLYSDEGQINRLKGYCHPARFASVSASVSSDVMSKLPPASGYAMAKFPTPEEYATAKETVVTNWDAVVGAAVK